MHRVLVPLDGSELAPSILPDARRLAGPGGTIILVREVAGRDQGMETHTVEQAELDASEEYLESIADHLADLNVSVETHALAMGDPAEAIVQAAELYQAQAIACATHARGGLERVALGSVASQILGRSSIPVLLRHPDRRPQLMSMFAKPRHLMVPLDGSLYAERALPLAMSLAAEWGAAVHLVSVVPTVPLRFGGQAEGLVDSVEYARDVRRTQAYLDLVALDLPGDIRTHIRLGGVVDQLIAATDEFQITDVVVASHGRTGLRRAVLGSVTDELVRRLQLPIFVLPARAAGVELGSARVPAAAS